MSHGGNKSSRVPPPIALSGSQGKVPLKRPVKRGTGNKANPTTKSASATMMCVNPLDRLCHLLLPWKFLESLDMAMMNVDLWAKIWMDNGFNYQLQKLLFHSTFKFKRQ